MPRGSIEFINYDRLSRCPRLILDENIDFSSLNILLRHGLAQRCSGVYQSWCKERKFDNEGLEQRQTADERKEVEATVVRTDKGILKWLAEQAVPLYANFLKDSPEAEILPDDLRKNFDSDAPCSHIS